MEKMNKNTPKILGLVTLYNPELPDAAYNIMRYLPYLDSLIIWDNSPLEANLKQLVLGMLAEEANKVIWHGDGNNNCQIYPESAFLSQLLGALSFFTEEEYPYASISLALLSS